LNNEYSIQGVQRYKSLANYARQSWYDAGTPLDLQR